MWNYYINHFVWIWLFLDWLYLIFLCRGWLYLETTFLFLWKISQKKNFTIICSCYCSSVCLTKVIRHYFIFRKFVWNLPHQIWKIPCKSLILSFDSLWRFIFDYFHAKKIFNMFHDNFAFQSNLWIFYS